MAEENEKKEENEKETGPKKSMLKWIVLAGVLIVMGAGGFVGWRMFFAQEADASAKQGQVAEKAAKVEPEAARIVCPLDSFVVNLLDQRNSGQRYLKTTIELEVVDDAGRDKLEKNKAQLRDTILLLLTSQSFKEISSIEGKLDLKQGLLTRINQTLGSSLVRRIYFTEFVVQ